ncbi:PadR family transcriptional regulator [Streptomyces goshikiensis]|uniref:PadR family transcriptional regulator n=1 Tax=Streptomyces goshikiensis TaxID=1942 RepID=UPI002AE09493|nr:PadR family transcriptional regulator [Streptomyces goshikiensis]
MRIWDPVPGTVYPILDRLAERGWVKSWDETSPHPGHPARRYYELTDVGRLQATEALAARPSRRGYGVKRPYGQSSPFPRRQRGCSVSVSREADAFQGDEQRRAPSRGPALLRGGVRRGRRLAKGRDGSDRPDRRTGCAARLIGRLQARAACAGKTGDTTGHDSHRITTPPPDQRKRRPHVRKDNDF